MRHLQRLIWDWGMRTFGAANMTKRMRALRLLEEALELAQASGVEESVAMKCIGVVYSRPPGNVMQEIGGVAVTLAAYCESAGTDIKTEMVTEIGRVLSKPADHFRQRNDEKEQLGLR